MRPWLRRPAMIAVLVALLAGAGVIDREVARSTPPPAPVGTLSAVSVSPPRGTESSAWFCAGGTGSGGGAPATIVLTNGSPRPVAGTVTVVAATTGTAAGPGAGAHVLSVVVPPHAETTLAPAQLGSSSSVLAASVVLDGGGVAVSQAVSSPLGWSMAPCASSAATSWYFAHGATAQGGGLTLSLFNPGATDATVDVALVTANAGVVTPAAYQGIDVAPGSLVTENIGDHAADDNNVATEVTTLSGRVVATELESDGANGNGGLSLALGNAVPANRWAFAENTDVPGGSVVFHVLNPSASAASVSVAIDLPQGSAAEPITVAVPAQSLATLVAQGQTRIPASVPYAAVFTSTGAGVVVSRQIVEPAGAPTPTPEDGNVSGVPDGSSGWLVPTLVPPGSGVSSFAVVDLGSRPTTVQVLSPAGHLSRRLVRTLRPGVPLVIGPNPESPFGTIPFEVSAGQPVAVEMDALPAAGPGVVVVPALATG